MRRPEHAPCTGTVLDLEDGDGPHCLLCGWSPVAAPTLEGLERMGIQGWENRQESAGHGRLSALEAEGFHSGPRHGHSQSEMGRRVRP